MVSNSHSMSWNYFNLLKELSMILVMWIIINLTTRQNRTYEIIHKKKQIKDLKLSLESPNQIKIYEILKNFGFSCQHMVKPLNPYTIRNPYAIRILICLKHKPIRIGCRELCIELLVMPREGGCVGLGQSPQIRI